MISHVHSLTPLTAAEPGSFLMCHLRGPVSPLVHNKCPIVYCGADSSNLKGEKERAKRGGIKDKALRMRKKL